MFQFSGTGEPARAGDLSDSMPLPSVHGRIPPTSKSPQDGLSIVER
jgi:hypothetical protein